MRCGLNSTEQLGQTCIKKQIEDALASHSADVVQELTVIENGYRFEIDPSKCYGM